LKPAGTDVMPGSIYKSREGEAEIQALYDEALDGLGLRYESLTVGTRGSRSARGWR
jgi:hypothetical protein